MLSLAVPSFSPLFLAVKTKAFFLTPGRAQVCRRELSQLMAVGALGSWFLCGVVLLCFDVQICHQCRESCPVGLCCDGWHQRGIFHLQSVPVHGVESQPAPNPLPCLLLKEDQAPESNLGPTEVEHMWNMGPDES